MSCDFASFFAKSRTNDGRDVPRCDVLSVNGSPNALKNRKLDQSCTSNPKSEVSDWTSSAIPRRRMPANPRKAQELHQRLINFGARITRVAKLRLSS